MAIALVIFATWVLCTLVKNAHLITRKIPVNRKRKSA